MSAFVQAMSVLSPKASGLFVGSIVWNFRYVSNLFRVTVIPVTTLGCLIYQFAEPTTKLHIKNVFNVVGSLTHERVKLLF
jgi:hypothetical protein